MKSPSDHDRQTIVQMLRQFREAQETLLHSGQGSGGNPKLMPKTWTAEMRELERCLEVLARSKPRLHRQVMACYVDPTIGRRKMRGRMERRGKADVMVWPQLGPCAHVLKWAKLPEAGKASEYSCVVATYPSWVNKPLVALAVACLLREYEPPSDAVGPALPAEMLAA